MQPNKVLREFDSELNLLTDKVALLFSQMVAETPTLTTLSLAKNKVCKQHIVVCTALNQNL